MSEAERTDEKVNAQVEAAHLIADDIRHPHKPAVAAAAQKR